MSFLHSPAVSDILFHLFFTEVLMNTKTETSDLKWTIFSNAKPEVRNPSLTKLSVTNSDLVVTGSFWLPALPLLLWL